ncbi:MAG: hypothetical protein J6R32_10810 [Bacteroidales bacterium]|nr:hypothetical protein [Bacteroidales bacterium]
MVTASDKHNHKSKIQYFNIPCSFDIETTSFFEEVPNPKTRSRIKTLKEKRACMYIWQMSINGTEIFGRTWSQFHIFLGTLKTYLGLNYNRRIIFYVHNLAYEFQFLLGHSQISDVFARKACKPISCLLDNCIELKCSYFLSGLSLAKVAENLTTISVSKLNGNLDYSLIRHSGTPLTPLELDYCAYDVRIVYYFIKEEIARNENDITKIPLTKTGYVRRYVRNKIKEKYNYKVYRDKIKEFMVADKDLFTTLYKAFAGGYTHANVDYIDICMEDVASIDFSSSYPAQMLMHKYPMTRFKYEQLVNYSTFLEIVNRDACVFRVKFHNLQPKTSHHILSKSKCEVLIGETIDNGRVVTAEYAVTYMTDVDWKTFQMFYEFDEENINIDKFYHAKYKYLYRPILESILDLYESKTVLKGIESKKEEYLVSKGMLNGIYGMCVTNPVNDEISLDEDFKWKSDRPDLQEALTKNKNNGNQFLCYQWGVWVTAWARYELLKCVAHLDSDVMYCDTDSIKFLNYEKHKSYIESYNKRIKSMLERSALMNGFETERLHPVDKKGKPQQIGIFTFEGIYDKFKTLGAKRYAFEKKNKKTGEIEFHITVSGLPNAVQFGELDPDTNTYFDDNTPYKCCINKVKSPTQYIYNHNKFVYFRDRMTIPAEYSRLYSHTYIRKPYSCILTDYLGNTAEVHEECYIHMQSQDFHMGLAEDFLLYLEDVHDDNEIGSRVTRDELAINFWNSERSVIDVRQE